MINFENMKKIFFLFCVCYSNIILFAQQDPTFKMNVSSDSVLLGNQIQVEFIIENGKSKRFEPPRFDGFELVSGPNQSSSIQIINGDMKQKAVYSYILEPKNVGKISISAASIMIDDKEYLSNSITINVYPNPEGIKQEISPRTQTFEFGDWNELPKKNSPKETPPVKKERKTIKI